MKIYRNINEIKGIKFPVVTIGGFDGVHAGHRVILERLIKAASENNGESVVITFSPHPRLVLYNDNDFKLLTTDEEKIDILKELHIDHLLIYPFTKEFSELSSDSFIENIIVSKLHAKKLIIGYDHHFGSKRSGNINKLVEYSQKFGFEIEVIGPQTTDHRPQSTMDSGLTTISSTNIRRVLYQGNIGLANKMLGNEFNLTGKVVEGNRIGKNIGYPTANIDINNKYKIIPASGVYAVKVKVGSRKPEAGSWKLEKGMLYIGTRPTLSDGRTMTMTSLNSNPSLSPSPISIEVNIFNFDKDIYNENITVYFVERIRDDMKFDNLEALKQQITNDKNKIMQIFDNE